MLWTRKAGKKTKGETDDFTKREAIERAKADREFALKLLNAQTVANHPMFRQMPFRWGRHIP